MKTLEHLRRWKVHLLFGGGFLLAYAIYVVNNLVSGRNLSSSLLTAFLDIKPFEYIMFGLLWYGFASGWKSESRPSVTSLNLSSSKP
jgi:hypothetical protein